MKFQQTKARRNGDGSIDFDFYRASATSERRRALHDRATLRMASASVARSSIETPWRRKTGTAISAQRRVIPASPDATERLTVSMIVPVSTSRRRRAGSS